MGSNISSRLGIDSQTVFGMPPVEQILLTAKLGCGHVSLTRMPPPWKFDRFPPWSLLDDLALRRETKAALRDTGVVLTVAEGFVIRSEASPRDWATEFDLMAELGAESVSSVSMEPDAARALGQMDLLASMAAERDMLFLFEFAPPHTFNSLEKALAAIQTIGGTNARLLIDTMHLFRTGGTVADVSAIDPQLIGYLQLCDAPLSGNIGPDYYREASFERKCPGEGELPLAELLKSLSCDVKIGLEVPMKRELEAAGDISEPIRRLVTASNKLLCAVTGGRSSQDARPVACTDKGKQHA
jgi:sugar phosphate isomerase/epimerase